MWVEMDRRHRNTIENIKDKHCKICLKSNLQLWEGGDFDPKQTVILPGKPH